VSGRRAAGTGRRVALVVAALAAVLALGACSGGDDGDDAATTTTEDGGGGAPGEATGEATVEVGERSWSFALTSCATTDGRFTAQGDDGEGAMVVATFLVDSGAGSVTVTEGDRSWAAGPAGGTDVTEVEIDDIGVRGDGQFAERALSVEASEPAEPAEGGDAEGDAAEPAEESPPTDGSFSVRCGA
jgi:hypothetical protein